ncbi:Esterase FrsA [Trichinella pseudospiralis]
MLRELRGTNWRMWSFYFGSAWFSMLVLFRWSEIIARPAIGHLTRVHHCERSDIGRRALNLLGYCLYRQCRFQHCSFCWPLAESVCFSLRSFSGQAARPVAELFRPLFMLICQKLAL